MLLVVIFLRKNDRNIWSIKTITWQIFLCASNYHIKNDQFNQTINLFLKIINLIKIDKKNLSACLENANLRIGESNACIKVVK